jgi:hypothetical protein
MLSCRVRGSDTRHYWHAVRQSRHPTLEEDYGFPISISLKESDNMFEVSHSEASGCFRIMGQRFRCSFRDTFYQRCFVT